MNLLFFITGDTMQYHAQCYFSILSFLAQGDVTGICIYTNAPQFYNQLEALEVKTQVEVLTPEQIREWRGNTDFFWRLKIKVMEDFAKKNPNEHLVYLDTDTFLYRSSKELVDGLNKGQAFMHKDEGDLGKMRHTAAKTWMQIDGHSFGGVAFKGSAHMWNAGVVAIPAKGQLEAIQLALAICDDMCRAGVIPLLVEQFSLSVALSHCFTLRPAEPMIGHYWGNKEGWNKLINDFLVNAHICGKPVQEIIAELRIFDYNQQPISRPVNNTQQRLIKLVKKLIAEKQDIWLSTSLPAGKES